MSERRITAVRLYGGSTFGYTILTWAACVAIARGWAHVEAVMARTGSDLFPEPVWIAREST